MYFVYAISSINKNYIYVGITDNLERRIGAHNKGHNKTTRSYCPFRIILTEQVETRIIAREREKYLKTGCGKEFLKTLV